MVEHTLDEPLPVGHYVALLMLGADIGTADYEFEVMGRGMESVALTPLPDLFVAEVSAAWIAAPDACFGERVRIWNMCWEKGGGCCGGASVRSFVRIRAHPLNDATLAWLFRWRRSNFRDPTTRKSRSGPPQRRGRWCRSIHTWKAGPPRPRTA